jgi:hypothetical protein
MSDYILFDVPLRDRFVQFITDQGLEYTMQPDRIAGYVVTLPDDLAEEIAQAIEVEYEALMDEQQNLVESADASVEQTLMTITVSLTEGQPFAVHLPALYARRLHEHFTLDEIRELVTVIAKSAVNPTLKSACCQA